MPYRCGDCGKYFSLRTGTVMERSPIPLHKWMIASFLLLRGKGVSSLQLARDLGITQKSAWFMLHRLRHAMRDGEALFAGPVEVDEVYIGGMNKCRHWDKRAPTDHRGWTHDKTPVMGARDRATGRIVAAPVPSVVRETAEAFVHERIQPETNVYTDCSKVYWALEHHESVNHSRGEYVRGDVHINGMESFWALLKRAWKGVYHWWSVQHMHRYVDECAARHNLRGLAPLERMGAVLFGFPNRRLTWKELVS